MSSVSIKFEGVDKLVNALNKGTKSSTAAKKVVRRHGTKLTQTMSRNAVFTKGYSTGETQRSIGANSPKFMDGGLEAHVGATTEYAPYLEYGTRFMAAQPFCDKSLKQIEPSFILDLTNAVSSEIK